MKTKNLLSNLAFPLNGILSKFIFSGGSIIYAPYAPRTEAIIHKARLCPKAKENDSQYYYFI